MELNNQVFLNKFILNLAKASDEGISFNKGELLKGQVQEVKENGLVSIFIKGKLIEALSEVMVNKGQQLFLMVDDMKEGRVVLKVMTPELLSKAENANLAGTLKEIGVPPDQANLQIAKKLIQHNLPVNSESLKAMAKGVSFLGEATAKNLEIVGTAMANNTPISKPVLSALASFVDNKADLASLAKELINILNRMEGNASTPRPAMVNIAPNLIDEGKPVPTNMAANLTVEAKAVPPNITNSLAAEPKTMPVNITASPVPPAPISTGSAEVVSQANTQQIQPAITPLANTWGGGMQTVFSPSTERVFSLLNQLLTTLLVPVNTDMPENTRQEIIEALKTNLANDKDLIRGLNLVKDILTQKEIPEVNKSVVSSIINTIENVEKEIVGTKLLNVMTKFTADNTLSYYYVSFPVKVNEEYRLCELKIDKNVGKTSLVDQDNIKFVVSLETANLGLVLFHVDWHKNKMLNFQGVVETPEVKQHINAGIKGLINNLQSLGYTVDFQGIKVVSDQESLRLRLQEAPEVVKPFVIDIRV